MESVLTDTFSQLLWHMTQWTGASPAVMTPLELTGCRYTVLRVCGLTVRPSSPMTGVAILLLEVNLPAQFSNQTLILHTWTGKSRCLWSLEKVSGSETQASLSMISLYHIVPNSDCHFLCFHLSFSRSLLFYRSAILSGVLSICLPLLCLLFCLSRHSGCRQLFDIFLLNL